MIRTSLVAVLLFVSIASSAFAQVKLQWKIPDGQQATTTEKTLSQQTLTLGEMNLESKSEQTMVLKTVAGKPADDGTIQVTGKIESLKTDLTLPGGVELHFDSSKPVEPQGTAYDILLDILKVVSKAEWTSVHDKTNHVVEIKGWKKILESLDESLRPLVKYQTDPDYLKAAANHQFDTVPSTPVKLGDTWKREFTARLEGGQHLTFKTTYQYDGTIEKDGVTLDKITFKSTDVEYGVEPQPDAKFSVKKSDLKIDSSDGLMLFDRKVGAIVSRTEKMRVTGELTLEIGDKEIPGKLDLRIEKSNTVK